ncbi:MAG: hypothetical protein OXE51_10655 [Gammaproteobacteria bacterium]|nr:hypothetical protein [Gammaproteobacteria bacterium]
MNFVNWSGLLRHLPAFAFVAAAVWLAARIALSAWEWTQVEPPAGLPDRSAEAAEHPASKAPGSRLFGEPRARAAPVAAGPPGLLNSGKYRLRGVVASTRQGMAHAIIESSGSTRAYFPGDSLAAGLTLSEVRPNEVFLRQGAEIVRLPLASLGPSTARGAVRAGISQFSIADPPSLLAAPPRMSLSQILSMEPVMDDDGAMRGYRVSPRRSRALFDALGLVSGDLVVAVNGVPIDSATLQQATREMGGGGDMMLTVDREGEQLEIRVGSESFGLLAM